MKRVILFAVFFISIIFCNAQELTVKSFTQKANDLSASTNPRYDNNNVACALVKVQLAAQGAQFEGNVVGEIDYKTSEYWVYMANGSKRLKIKLEGYLPLEVCFSDYSIKMLESKVSYELTLLLPEVIVQNQNSSSQYLVFYVKPTDAIVKVNDMPWENKNGTARKLVPFGTYSYSIQSSDYHSTTGTVTVNSPDKKVEVNIELQPNFGWIEVTGDGTLKGASVYIDNTLIGQTPIKSGRLKSGQHEVLVTKELYSAYSTTVTVDDNKTTNVVPSLNANFSSITLTVDDDAEIWVNDEKKGVSSWTGDLEFGTSRIECRKTNHDTSFKVVEVTDKMKGQTIKLDAPRPICGSLNVESEPDMADLYIDDKKMEKTPILINSLLIGEHTLRLEKPGYIPLVKTIIIEKGQTLTFNGILTIGSNVTIKSDSPGDLVYIDGKRVGSSPYSTMLAPGEYVVKVAHNGSSQEKTLNVYSDGESKEIAFQYLGKAHITTDPDNATVYIDDQKVGKSPLDINLPVGNHSITAKRWKKEADQHLYVSNAKENYNVHLVLLEETPPQKELTPKKEKTKKTNRKTNEEGKFFFTVDASICANTETGGVGVGFGVAKNLGWFASLSSDFDSRFSMIGGTMFSLSDHLYVRTGAGVGISSITTGLDLDVGLLLNLNKWNFTADFITTNYQTAEFKIGLDWKVAGIIVGIGLLSALSLQ